MHADLGTRLVAFGQQHVEDVAGLVVTEQLAELLLVVRHAVLAHQLDEVPLGVAGQGRLAEVRVVRKEVGRLGVQVGEVAAPAAGHEDFLAWLVGVVEQQHPAAATGTELGAHQAGGAGAKDDHVGGVHGMNLQIEMLNPVGVGSPANATMHLLPRSRVNPLLQGALPGFRECGLSGRDP
ncbi:hypothetical protein D9M73_166250 [compost metagenome]